MGMPVGGQASPVSEMPFWVVLVLGLVFVAFGAGLFYLGTGAEKWGRKSLYARAAMWSAAGVGVVVASWSEGAAGILFVAAVLGRLVVLLIPWNLPTTNPTPDSPPDPR
jgi:MFS family permease